MALTVEDLMQHAFVITINDDRLNAFLNRWKSYGLTAPRVFRGYSMPLKYYPGLKMSLSSNIANLSITHLALVKMAQALDFPYIFILEDDALPRKDILERLPEALSAIPRGIRLLRLGYLPYKGINYGVRFRYGPDIGSHAYIVFRDYYADYARIFNDVEAVADGRLISYNQECHGDEKTILSTSESLFAQKNPIVGYRTLHESKVAWMTDLSRNGAGGHLFDL